MSYFSEYLTTVFTAGICAFICETLCQSFNASKTLCRAMNIITSLMLFCVIVFPLCNAITGTHNSTKITTPEIGGNAPIQQQLTSLTVSQLEKTITVKMFEETGIYPESISINFNGNTDEPQIRSVSITVDSTADDDRAVISEYLKNLFGEGIKVEIAEL